MAYRRVICPKGQMYNKRQCDSTGYLFFNIVGWSMLIRKFYSGNEDVGIVRSNAVYSVSLGYSEKCITECYPKM